MNKIAVAVIGSGYGDEGKGLMTDYLVRKFTEYGDRVTRPPVNVRFNGGGQAGHTVVSDRGRHVFSHIGAGSYANASTFLSSRFIVNPTVLKREYSELVDQNVIPQIEIHPHANVTVIFDILLNRLREVARGDKRHGSCGLGINETVTRACAGFKIAVCDLQNSSLPEIIQDIKDKWWDPQRQAIDLSKADQQQVDEIMAMWNVDVAINSLRDGWAQWAGNVNFAPIKNLSRNDFFVFEGAQGLELDEFMGMFPHVTRSQTGLEGALIAAHEIGITEITPVYVTRAYKTRHGAGPLPYEGHMFSNKSITDKTNVTGKWQGEFRYGPLYIGALSRAITIDLEQGRALAERLRIKINTPEIAITCLDQVSEPVTVLDKGRRIRAAHEQLIEMLNGIARVRYLSYGETAQDVKEI